MRKTLLFGLFTLALSFGLSQVTYANCTFGGVTIDGGNILNCPSPLQGTPVNTATTPPNNTTTDGDEVNIPAEGGVQVPSGVAIDTDDGPDVVTTSGIIISDDDSALETNGGGDVVTINDGIIMATGDDAVQLGSGADMLEVNGGSITSTTNDAVRTGSGSDFVEINGGTFNAASSSINTRGGADTLRIFGGTFNAPLVTEGGAENVLLQGGTYNGNGFNLGGGNDFINIAADIDDLGDINCGGGANNTIMFSLNVPDAELPALSAELAAATATDDIVINGNTYSWIGCEIIENNLNGVVANLTLSPISAVNPLDTFHTVTVDLSTNIGGLNEGVEVFFEITSGPNEGLNSEIAGRCSNPNCSTDANGEVSWTYSGTLEAGPGTDTIVSSIDDVVVGAAFSNTVEKEWVFPLKDIPTLGEWGLIAMASLLGIVGFMVVRRRQVAA